MSDELRLHLDLLSEEYEQSGMSKDEAQLAARRRFGNMTNIKERSRDIRRGRFLEDLIRDVQ